MTMIHDRLIELGVAENQIIAINFEHFAFIDLVAADQLYHYIRDRLPKNKRCYLLLDEIQEVAGWEKAVNAVFEEFDTDVYLSGSNSKLLSSELSTYLSGRYVELPIHTLSFKECLQFRREYRGLESVDLYHEFNLFLRMGGFPVLHVADFSGEDAKRVVCKNPARGKRQPDKPQPPMPRFGLGIIGH